MESFNPTHSFDPVTPSDITDNQFVFSLPGDTITSATVSCTPTGLNIASTTFAGSTVSFRISGGTPGVLYVLTCTVNTQLGREVARSASITCQDIV